MATQIQIKKPATAGSTTAPTTSNVVASELAMVFGTATTANGGGRLYIGNHDNSAVNVIGGYYFTDMLKHAHGTLTASAGIITNSANAIDTLNLGTSSSAAGSMKFLEGTGTGTNHITLQGTASVGTSTTLTLPAVDGNVVTSGDSGSIASGMIADTAVTLAKIQNVAANSLLIRNASSAGALTELAVANTKIVIGDGSGFGAFALSGDVTMTNGGVVAIGAAKVTYAQMQATAANNRLLGAATAGTIGEVQVATAMIATAAVTVAKMQNVGGNSLLVRDAADSGVMSALAVADTKIIIGDSAGFGAFALSGDVTMTNGGVVAIGAQKVTNTMMADDAVGADELAANAVVNASVASGAAIAMSKTAFVDGDGLTLSTNTLSVDADQSGQITAVGNLTVGSGSANASVSSDGAHDLIMQTNAGTNSGLITITDGANGNITIAPNGTGQVDVDTSRIVGVSDPTAAQDAATKSYVDATKTGLDVKDSVSCATTADVSTWTYANGTAGVGATLTAAGDAAVSLDGVALTLNMRVLVKDQDPTTENGIYYVSVAGAVGATLVLTRALDANQPAEFTGGTFTFVEQGTIAAENGYVFTHNGTPTFGTTTLTVSQFSGAGQIVAGTGLTKDGNEINVIGSATIIAATNSLAVNSSGTAHQILRSGGTALTAATFGALALNQSAAVTGTLPVGNGGMGAATFTQYGVLLGNAANAVAALAPGTAGYFLTAGSSANPSWTNIMDGGTF